MNNPDFETAFATYLDGCQKIVSNYKEHHYPNLPEEKLEYSSKGRKYRKVIRYTAINGERHHVSVHAFVNMETGDVLKPAGWSTPAKHARGNIYDVHNGLKYMGPHGPAYLR